MVEDATTLLLTCTVIDGVTPSFAEVSRRRAARVYVPFGSAVVSHERSNGASESGTPVGVPFTRSCAETTPTLSCAVIATGVTPETVAPCIGVVTVPVGDTTSVPVSAKVASSMVRDPFDTSPWNTVAVTAPTGTIIEYVTRVGVT